MVKKRFDFRSGGKPIFNLDINIECLNMSNARQDENGFVFPDDIENIAIAIKFAKEIVVGPRHVTDKGYLVNGWRGSNISKVEGTIDIMENLTQLLSFARTNQKRTVISFYHGENRAVGNITLDRKEGVIFNNALDLEKEIEVLKKSVTGIGPRYRGEQSTDKDLPSIKGSNHRRKEGEHLIAPKDGCPTAEARRH
jgi:hypothetical protein